MDSDKAETAVDLLKRDPWEHRSRNMVCMTCMWWVRKGETALGRCRRRAPTMAGFPAAYGHDWCGDHKLDEKEA